MTRTALLFFFCAYSAHVTLCQNLNLNTCPPIESDHLKIKKDGNGKARDHCIDWIELSLPCVEGSSSPNKTRIDKCKLAIPSLIPESNKEFSHTVFLGNTSDSGCDGVLISDQWVLTAAHCIKDSIIGKGTKAKLVDDVEFHIVEIRKHPTFTMATVYDDIALIKLDKKVKLSSYVIPACLDFEGLEPKTAVTTRSNRLQLVTDCKDIFKPSRKTPSGLNSTTQICYAHPEHKDNCEMEVTGSLQVMNENVYCTFTVVGVSSFGVCGTRYPNVYTRVQPYVEWIESIVWP